MSQKINAIIESILFAAGDSISKSQLAEILEISEKKVPILGNVPLLGVLFKKKIVTMVDTEFVIYLVPFVEKTTSEELSEEENFERLMKKYSEVAK